MPPHALGHDPVEGRVGLPMAPRKSRWRCVTPLDAGIGHAPHSLANAASDRTRVGLSPATIIISAAESDPTPNAWRSVGAAAIVIASSPTSWVRSRLRVRASAWPRHAGRQGQTEQRTRRPPCHSCHCCGVSREDRGVRCARRCRRSRPHERLPRGQVVVAGLRRDVVEVDALAEELIEVGVQVGHGDSGSLSDLTASTRLRKLLRRLDLVGMTGFEPATP